MASLHSPKNKFAVYINFDKPQKDFGSSVSYTAMTIEQCRSYAEQQSGEGKCTVRIRENKKEYPSFEWVEVEKYILNK